MSTDRWRHALAAVAARRWPPWRGGARCDLRPAQLREWRRRGSLRRGHFELADLALSVLPDSCHCCVRWSAGTWTGTSTGRYRGGGEAWHVRPPVLVVPAHSRPGTSSPVRSAAGSLGVQPVRACSVPHFCRSQADSVNLASATGVVQGPQWRVGAAFAGDTCQARAASAAAGTAITAVTAPLRAARADLAPARRHPAAAPDRDAGRPARRSSKHALAVPGSRRWCRPHRPGWTRTHA
jgi:hypothetical protein